MLHLSPRFVDEVLVPPTGVGDIGLAHRHLSPGCQAPIEMMGDRATACVRQQRLQPNHLLLYPLGLRVDAIADTRRLVCPRRSCARLCTPLSPLKQPLSPSTEHLPEPSPHRAHTSSLSPRAPVISHTVDDGFQRRRIPLRKSRGTVRRVCR